MRAVPAARTYDSSAKDGPNYLQKDGKSVRITVSIMRASTK